MCYLLRFCLRLLLLLCGTLLVNISLARAGSQSTTVATIEQQVHELVNQHRTMRGLTPLAYSDEVARVAREHSRNMASGYVGMGHEGADERGRTLAQAITYKQFAENVAANSYGGSSPAQEVLSSWLNSPGHRANIEGTFDLTGVGVARNGNSLFFTQIFLTTARSSRPATAQRRPRQRSTEREYSEAQDQPQSSFQRQRVYPPTEEESDPRQRPGRKRVRGGYVQDLQDLEESH